MIPPLPPTEEEIQLLDRYAPRAAQDRLNLYVEERRKALDTGRRIALSEVRHREVTDAIKLIGLCTGFLLALTSLFGAIYLIDKGRDVSKLAPILGAMVLAAGVYTSASWIDAIIKALGYIPSILKRFPKKTAKRLERAAK